MDQTQKQIKGEIYQSLREALTAPVGKTKKSWTNIFTEECLKQAKANPSGPLGQYLLKQVMQDGILDKLDADTEKLLARDQDFARYRILKTCFAKQRDVILDDVIPKKVLCTGRRQGKTNAVARLLVTECVTPNTPCIYIHLKFENAIKQAFDLCTDAAKECELPIERSSKAEGIIQFVNGSSILFKGNNDKSAADGFRGNKFRIVAIDEAAYQTNMTYLLNDVIGPATADFEHPMIILASTPPRTPGSYFESCYNNKEWKQYHWDMTNNPYIKNADKVIQEVCKEKGLTVESPLLQREYFGLFVYDTEALLFKDAKYYTEIPSTFVPDHITIGVDFGFEDDNAIVTLAYNMQGQAYVIEEKKWNHSTVSTIVEEIKKSYQVAKEYAMKIKDFDLGLIQIFTDCNEKSIAYEVYQQGLPCYTCYKYNKDYAISTLIDSTRTGKIQCPESGALQDEFQKIIYKRDQDDNLTTEIDDSAYHPNALDALLYAARQMWYDVAPQNDSKLGGESTIKKQGWNK